jgi:protein-disulfide isomerase
MGCIHEHSVPHERRHRSARRLVVVAGQAQTRGKGGVVSSYESPARLAEPVTERDHIRGALTAPVVLVEYGDYECPHCGRAYWVIKRLREELGDRLGFVFRNFPVAELHPRAESVAQALEAASSQDHFWEMHDWFYEHQHQLEGLDLERHAQAAGMDVERWKKDQQQPEYRERVRQDIESGRQSGVSATPTFFINGTQYRGPYDFDSTLAAIRHTSR